MPDAREATRKATPKATHKGAGGVPATAASHAAAAASGAMPAPTALMRQYLDVKARYPDAIVFFRLGDFYEMFYEDAVYVSRALNLTLTTRDKGKEDPVPMCGIPHHAARGYLAKLTDLGHRIAICEQLEDPRSVRGIVKRDVVRVVTPGVILDEESLDPRAPNHVAAVLGDGRRGFGLAFLDVTTGSFHATEAPTLDALLDELARAEPRELVIGRADTDLAAAIRRAYPRLVQTASRDDRARAAPGSDNSDSANSLILPPRWPRLWVPRGIRRCPSARRWRWPRPGRCWRTRARPSRRRRCRSPTCRCFGAMTR